MTRNASRVQRKTPVRLTLTTACHSSSGISSSSRGGAPIPALLKSRSTRPCRVVVTSKRLRTDSSSVTSVGTGSSERSGWALARSSKRVRRRPASTTVQPSPPSAVATAAPMPLPAPVTTAILSIGTPIPSGLSDSQRAIARCRDTGKVAPLSARHVAPIWGPSVVRIHAPRGWSALLPMVIGQEVGAEAARKRPRRPGRCSSSAPRCWSGVPVAEGAARMPGRAGPERRTMSSIPAPDERTIYSSHRHDGVDSLAWPVFSEQALDMLQSAGEVLHPGPGELLWDAGDPYDLHLVLAGGVLLLDRRDDRVVFVIEAGDFVGELGMLMGQRAFLPGVAIEGTELLRLRVEELRKLVEISGELSDVLLSAFDARRGLLNRIGEGGLVLAGDDDR